MKSSLSTSHLSSLLANEVDRLELFFLKSVLKHVPNIPFGTLDLQFPNGEQLQFGSAKEGEPRAEIILHSFKPFKRLLQAGHIGLAESYIAGEWDSPDLVSLFRWGVGNEHSMPKLINGNVWLRTLNRINHFRRSNTKRGSRKNIAYHYDLGNDFYQLWLDPSMTYSSALFSDSCSSATELTLEQAQLNKYRKIAQMLDIKPGDTVLEIGCGWGGFAELAAKEFGAQVHGITLSKEQLAYATQRIEQAGLSEQCHFSLTDYRDIQQPYNHIVSIEMFEAVGEEHWPAYFATIKQSLKPGGKAVLQVISIEESRFEEYRRNPDFIQRYIFPGGMLPSPERLQQSLTRQNLQLAQSHCFGADYAKTLSIWRHSFLEQWPRIQVQGFDEHFKRMWLYYLTYCEAGFTCGAIDVGLYQLENH